MRKLNSLIELLFVVAMCMGNISLANEKQQTKLPISLSVKENNCSFGAFVQESAPAGLNVRQTPSLSGKIIGKLPPVIENPDLAGFKIKIEVDVLGSKNGWFFISNAKDNTTLTGKSARSVFSGRGWVSGRKLTVKSQANKGYLQPLTTSPIAVSSNDNAGFDNDEMVRAGQLISCLGNWVLVDYSINKLSADMVKSLNLQAVAKTGIDKEHLQVWVNQICAIQETSCDGTAMQK